MPIPQADARLTSKFQDSQSSFSFTDRVGGIPKREELSLWSLWCPFGPLEMGVTILPHQPHWDKSTAFCSQLISVFC
jgi:hypothetical protein